MCYENKIFDNNFWEILVINIKNGGEYCGEFR